VKRGVKIGVWYKRPPYKITYRAFATVCGAGLFRASAEVRAGTISKSTQSRQFAIH
jgi:hypothetical protein